jgi:hypothetical protein
MEHSTGNADVAERLKRLGASSAARMQRNAFEAGFGKDGGDFGNGVIAGGNEDTPHLTGQVGQPNDLDRRADRADRRYGGSLCSV